MAVLDKLPSAAIIRGYKGTLDFYLWKGIACVRSWPHWQPRTPYATESRNQADFAYINRLWSTLPENVQALYRDMAVGTPYTAKDVLVISYMKGIPT